MKFLVSSSDLLKNLQGIGGVLNSSNTLPILDNFLFEIKGKALTISASDLETTMTSVIEVQSKEDGTICIPARMLMDILKAFPEQPLTFDIDDKTSAIEISSDNGKYKLSGFSGSEFPKVPTMESPSKAEIPAEVLAKAISKAIFAAGNDDLRPVMSGVYFELEKEGITFVATDAHKLVRYKRTDVNAEKEFSFIVPKKPLNLLKGLMAASKSNVTMEYNESNAFFAFDQTTLICRLIDGKYPNYAAVIPNENPNRLTIDRTELLSSIKRVSIFANKTTNQVRLKMTGSELVISAEDLDFSNEANERLTCNYQGEDMEIGFNSRFLVEMLANMDAQDCMIEMSAPNRAGIIVPGGDSEANEDILMLVMPVMLNT